MVTASTLESITEVPFGPYIPTTKDGALYVGSDHIMNARAGLAQYARVHDMSKVPPMFLNHDRRAARLLPPTALATSVGLVALCSSIITTRQQEEIAKQAQAQLHRQEDYRLVVEPVRVAVSREERELLGRTFMDLTEAEAVLTRQTREIGHATLELFSDDTDDDMVFRLRQDLSLLP